MAGGVTREELEEALDGADLEGSWDIDEEGNIIVGIDQFGAFGGYELPETEVKERLDSLKVIARYMGIED